MKRVSAMYIHIPFCNTICSYCDFTKLLYSFFNEDKYIDALIKEIRLYKPNKVNTIYIGGGTPSILSISALERLFKEVSKYLKKSYEFSIEVNPESVSEEKVKLFAKYGVNRVSIGVESSNEGILKLLNRTHNNNEVINTVNLLNKYNITNYSFDFIYGINGLSVNDINNDLNLIKQLNPKHVSFYSLILEDNTCLKNNNYKEANDNDVIKQYKYIHKNLFKLGYKQYEVSNYCVKGYESRHNLVYWNNLEYYGFGLGTSGYINSKRYTNTKNINKYLKGEYVYSEEVIDLDSKKEEYIMLKLRLNKGFNLNEYKKLFNESIEISKKDVIDKLVKEKLIKITSKSIYTTFKGMLLLNKVILELI